MTMYHDKNGIAKNWGYHTDYHFYWGNVGKKMWINNYSNELLC